MQYGSILMIMAALSVFPALGLAETYYVSVSGNDAWPGTEEKPFASIAAAQRAARPGSIVTVTAGTYPGPLQIAAAGTKDAPITFMAAEDGAVVIDGTGTVPHSNLVVISGNHLVFEGFEIVNAMGSGVTLWGTRNVTLRNNVVHGSYRAGIFVGYSARGVSQDNIVEDNIVYDNVLENNDRSMPRRWAAGIEVLASDGTSIRRNRSYRNFGEGVSVMSSKDVIVENNLLYDNYSVNIYLDNAQGAKVSGNTAGTSSDPEFFKNGKPAYGAAIVDKEAPIPFPSTDNVIIGNQWVGIEGIFVDARLRAKRNVLLPFAEPNISQPGIIKLDDQP